MSAVVTCPDWCTASPGHETDPEDDVRYHDGPAFGELVFIFATETTGAMNMVVNVETPVGGLSFDVADARALASDIAAAAEWLEAHR